MLAGSLICLFYALCSISFWGFSLCVTYCLCNWAPGGLPPQKWIASVRAVTLVHPFLFFFLSRLSNCYRLPSLYYPIWCTIGLNLFSTSSLDSAWKCQKHFWLSTQPTLTWLILQNFLAYVLASQLHLRFPEADYWALLCSCWCLPLIRLSYVYKCSLSQNKGLGRAGQKAEGSCCTPSPISQAVR